MWPRLCTRASPCRRASDEEASKRANAALQSVQALLQRASASSPGLSEPRSFVAGSLSRPRQPAGGRREPLRRVPMEVCQDVEGYQPYVCS